MKKNKYSSISYIITLFLLVFSIGLNVWLLTRKDGTTIVEKVVTKEVRDTIHDTIPEVRNEIIIKYRTDTLVLIDTIPGDTAHVAVEIPITQKEYSDDSTYRAWVSGYKPELDSIDIYRKTIYVEKTITKTRNKKFIFGPSITLGYNPSTKKMELVCGGSLTYYLFGF